MTEPQPPADPYELEPTTTETGDSTDHHPPVNPDRLRPPAPPTREAREREAYNTITDKIAGPSLRRSDNMASLIGGVVGAVIGAILGLTIAALIGGGMGSWPSWGLKAIGFCAVGGAILGVMLTGVVLMFIGLGRR